MFDYVQKLNWNLNSISLFCLLVWTSYQKEEIRTTYNFIYHSH